MFKKSLLAAAVLLISAPAFAMQVSNARIDSTGQYILVDVVHGGGCEDHTYSLKLIGGCAESFPVQCYAEVVDNTVDMCEAIVSNTAKISIADAGLNGSYYDGAKLTIKGEEMSTGAEQSTVVYLPSSSALPMPPAPSTKPAVSCVTHTGSILEIDADQTTMTLETTSGQVESYSIIDNQFASIETYPSIDQNIYKLDDGRSVVIEFQSNLKTGTGHFIRLTGEASPDFKSCRR